MTDPTAESPVKMTQRTNRSVKLSSNPHFTKSKRRAHWSSKMYEFRCKVDTVVDNCKAKVKALGRKTAGMLSKKT